VLAKLAAVEAGDVKVAEARDGSAEMREQHSGQLCWGVMPSGMLRHPVLRAER
jgi:hypothetical protein